MVIPLFTLTVGSFSETSWGTRRASAHFILFSEVPVLGALPFRTNSSTMPSISWILSLPLKTLDGSESALWGPPWFSACSSKGERLYEEAGCVFLCLVGFPSPDQRHGVTEVKRKALLKSTTGSNYKEDSHQRSKEEVEQSFGPWLCC